MLLSRHCPIAALWLVSKWCCTTITLFFMWLSPLQPNKPKAHFQNKRYLGFSLSVLYRNWKVLYWRSWLLPRRFGETVICSKIRRNWLGCCTRLSTSCSKGAVQPWASLTSSRPMSQTSSNSSKRWILQQDSIGSPVSETWMISWGCTHEWVDSFPIWYHHWISQLPQANAWSNHLCHSVYSRWHYIN